MLMRAVVVAALMAGAAAAALPNEDPRMEFTRWMQKHGKTYSSRSEFEARFLKYQATKERISGLNADPNDGATYELNKFADMSVPEFRAMPCGVDRLSNLKLNYTQKASPMPKFSAAPPTNYDWQDHGAVTPVKNQAQCGSCWAFSTIANIEGVWKIAGNNLIGLSEQQEVDCSQDCYGCSGGWPFLAMKDLLQDSEGKVDTESSYPYTAMNGQCSFKPSSVGATIKSYKSYCNEQTAPCSETDMVSLSYAQGPLSICLDAAWMQSYAGGIANPQGCDPNAIDHCVTITGWGEENGTPYWNIKNSWGADWGNQGYGKLIRGTGACGVNKVITMATC